MPMKAPASTDSISIDPSGKSRLGHADRLHLGDDFGGRKCVESINFHVRLAQNEQRAAGSSAPQWPHAGGRCRRTVMARR